MVNRGPSGIGIEVAPVFSPQAKSFLLQIPHQNIQEGYNTREYQQDQKTLLLCRLYISKALLESMEYQRQTPKWIN